MSKRKIQILISVSALLIIFFALKFFQKNENIEETKVNENASANPDPSNPSDSSAKPEISATPTSEPTISDVNLNGKADEEAFKEAGWQEVTEDEPDQQVLKLDPAGLSQKEVEYQVQMQTNLFKGEILNNVKAIALAATNVKTKIVAIENLGRSKDPLAQSLLIELYNQITEEQMHSEIIGRIKPETLSDDRAKFLFNIIADDNNQDNLRGQATSRLIVVALMQYGNQTVPTELSSKIPESYRPTFSKLWQTMGGK